MNYADLISGTEEKGINYVDELVSEDTNPGAIGDQPLNSVFTSIDKNQDPASFASHFIAGLADDPQTQMKVYAAARFPHLRPNERLKRYGVHKGNIVFMDDDGKLKAETPETFSQTAKEFLAKSLSHAPSMVMGGIGSLGGPATAAFGAAGGEGIRKSASAYFLDEPQTATGNALSMAGEGALAYTGDLAGRTIGGTVNYLGSKRGGVLGAQGGRAIRNINPEKVAEMEDLGKRFGIDLFAPQTTGSRRLGEKFRLLRDLDYSSDIIAPAVETQSMQVDNAVYNYLKGITVSRKTVSQTGQDVVMESKKYLQNLVDVRKNASKPFYDKAWAETKKVDIAPVIESIDESMKTAKGDVLSALLNTKKILQRPDLPKKTPSGKIISPDTMEPIIKGGEMNYETGLKGLHDAKVALDARIEKTKSKTIKRVYINAKNKLLEQMDAVSPDYKTARSIFSDHSTALDQVSRKTLLGEVSKLEGDKVINATKKILASPETKRAPESVLRLKNVISHQNPEIWENVLRDHLQGVFESIKQTATGETANIGGNFYKKVWGDTAQRNVLQKAMSKEQFETLGDFMKVLKTTGIVLGKESATATRSVLLDEIGGGVGVRNIIRAVGRPLRTKEYVMGEYLLDTMLKKKSRELAEAMISPVARNEIKRIVQLTDRTELALPAVTNFMAQIIARDFKREIKKEDDYLPPNLKRMMESAKMKKALQ